MFDPSGSQAPWDWYGPGAPSTERVFVDAPQMSRYTDVTNKVLYVKVAQTGAAADWKALAAGGVTVAGDLTITGTLTAGDVVITSA
jgi:hypothetical protein